MENLTKDILNEVHSAEKHYCSRCGKEVSAECKERTKNWALYFPDDDNIPEEKFDTPLCTSCYPKMMYAAEKDNRGVKNAYGARFVAWLSVYLLGLGMLILSILMIVSGSADYKKFFEILPYYFTAVLGFVLMGLPGLTQQGIEDFSIFNLIIMIAAGFLFSIKTLFCMAKLIAEYSTDAKFANNCVKEGLEYAEKEGIRVEIVDKAFIRTAKPKKVAFLYLVVSALICIAVAVASFVLMSDNFNGILERPSDNNENGEDTDKERPQPDNNENGEDTDKERPQPEPTDKEYFNVIYKNACLSLSNEHGIAEAMSINEYSYGEDNVYNDEKNSEEEFSLILFIKYILEVMGLPLLVLWIGPGVWLPMLASLKNAGAFKKKTEIRLSIVFGFLSLLLIVAACIQTFLASKNLMLVMFASFAGISGLVTQQLMLQLTKKNKLSLVCGFLAPPLSAVILCLVIVLLIIIIIRGIYLDHKGETGGAPSRSSAVDCDNNEEEEQEEIKTTTVKATHVEHNGLYSYLVLTDGKKIKLRDVMLSQGYCVDYSGNRYENLSQLGLYEVWVDENGKEISRR